MHYPEPEPAPKSPPLKVADELDWQTGASGLYQLKDVQWLRYTGVNNGASVYWKTSKQMADGVSAHIKDSVIAKASARAWLLGCSHVTARTWCLHVAARTWLLARGCSAVRAWLLAHGCSHMAARTWLLARGCSCMAVRMWLLARGSAHVAPNICLPVRDCMAAPPRFQLPNSSTSPSFRYSNGVGWRA